MSTALWTTSRGGPAARPAARLSGASVLLPGGETNAQPTCGEDNGDFSTFTVVGGKATAPTRHADQYKLKEGPYADGNTPAGGYQLGCSVHWFEQHPTFKDGPRWRCTSSTTCAASTC